MPVRVIWLLLVAILRELLHIASGENFILANLCKYILLTFNLLNHFSQLSGNNPGLDFCRQLVMQNFSNQYYCLQPSSVLVFVFDTWNKNKYENNISCCQLIDMFLLSKFRLSQECLSSVIIEIVLGCSY